MIFRSLGDLVGYAPWPDEVVALPALHRPLEVVLHADVFDGDGAGGFWNSVWNLE